MGLITETEGKISKKGENVPYQDFLPLSKTVLKRLIFQGSSKIRIVCLTHSLIHHFDTVPNSKKLQTTTEMWLLNNF